MLAKMSQMNGCLIWHQSEIPKGQRSYLRSESWASWAPEDLPSLRTWAEEECRPWELSQGCHWVTQRRVPLHIADGILMIGNVTESETQNILNLLSPPPPYGVPRPERCRWEDWPKGRPNTPFKISRQATDVVWCRDMWQRQSWTMWPPPEDISQTRNSLLTFPLISHPGLPRSASQIPNSSKRRGDDTG